MLKLTTEHLEGGVIILHLSGHIGNGEKELASPKLIQSLKDEAVHLLLNFNRAASLNTSGIRFLLTLKEILREKKGKVICYSLPDSIMEILQVAGFDHTFALCETKEEALALLQNLKGEA